MRRALVLGVLSLACGRDQVLLLGDDDGDGGIVPKDALVPPRDGSVGRDGGLPPFDGFVPDDGGAVECSRPRDCLDKYGRPPFCPDGRPSAWQCAPEGFCYPECMAASCFDDCDCDPFLACLGGICQLANRLNLCCTNPACPPGAECIEPSGGRGVCEGAPDAGMPDDGGRPRDAGRPEDGGLFDAGVPDTGTIETPVGAPCASQFACGPIGFCIEEANGFPGGYCSQDCGPGGNPCPMGATCRGFDAVNAICLDACNSNAECRAGYICVQVGLDPQRVCWPMPGGSTNPNGNPVGGACNDDQQCRSGLQCLNFAGWPGGYCTKQFCDPITNPCPNGSECFNFPGFFSLCLDECPVGGTMSDCRPDYYCLGPTGQPGGCIPD